ncbi:MULTISPECIES: hypothetical protein [Sphingobacterium]|nr:MULTISPECIES: hypothetical protein [Sphingobacterium]MBB1646394.1 hypothetical protein [Sphingobacterium sp. UME9]
MKRIFITGLLLCLFSITGTMAQNVKRQTDKHIVHQQERMVHKQWDRKKFTPTSGFLGLNYQYWLTWAWHPNYPKTDRRPLSGTGPQTLRMGMVLAMQQTDEAYKKHADTIRNVAVTEALNYSGMVTDADPLWLLYYRREFGNLIDDTDTNPLAGLSPGVSDYLRNKGLLEWYNEERAELKERLGAARTTTLDRGSRIMAYHRLLAEHRKLLSAWEAKKNYASKFLLLSKSRDRLQSENPDLPEFATDRSDVQIAEDILKRTK